MDNAGNQNAGKPQAATIRYIDQPDCRETFADSINNVFFDGQTMRIEFGITRMDDMKQGQQLSGRRHPACRLVLPVSAAIDLINRMQQTANALQQQGLLKPAGAAAPEAKPAGAGVAEAKPAGAPVPEAKPAGAAPAEVKPANAASTEVKPASATAAEPRAPIPSKSSLLDKLSALDKASSQSSLNKPSIFDKPLSDKPLSDK
jgi:hypothetical protein